MISAKKNLVYFSVCFNADYFKLADLLLKSILFCSTTNTAKLSFLVITTPDLVGRVEELSAAVGIPLLVHTAPLKTIFEAACARLRIFDYPLLDSYEKILYLDTDILIKGDLETFFEIPLEEKVYAIESGTIASPSFGSQFFHETVDKTAKGFNSGTLLFPNSLRIRDLFSRIRGHCESYADSKAPIPYCMDQPFINYHCMKSGLYNNTVLNPYVSLFEDSENVLNEATSVVCHFSFPIGNVWHKYNRMSKYFVKMLETVKSPLDPIDMNGRLYTWGHGTLEFTEKGIKTTWGTGNCVYLGSNWFNVSWSNHYHVLKMNADLTGYTGLRIVPNDFVICTGTYKSFRSVPANYAICSENTVGLFEDRKSMMKHYCKTLNAPKILEIGVFKGEFLDYMVENCGIGSIDGVDLFEGINYSGDVDGNNVVVCDIGKAYTNLREKYRGNRRVRLYRSYSGEFLQSVEDGAYDIIYIDGDHTYHGVKSDLKLSFKKIKNGGYIMGHDYEMNMEKAKTVYDFGVKKAVDEFCSEYGHKIIAKAMDGCVSFCIQVQKN